MLCCVSWARLTVFLVCRTSPADLYTHAAFVVYEYLVTFSNEVQLFWGRDITGASILFFINRYMMLFYAIFSLPTGGLLAGTKTVSLDVEIFGFHSQTQRCLCTSSNRLQSHLSDLWERHLSLGAAPTNTLRLSLSASNISPGPVIIFTVIVNLLVYLTAVKASRPSVSSLWLTKTGTWRW